MRKDDQPHFMMLLARVMAGYGKSLPEASICSVWLDALEPFAPATIAQAFADYSMEKPDYAPAPNSIAARCRLLDGRPGENEAWAQALLCRSQQATVVWTREMADAFAVAQPLLEADDDIGGRMAFKEAYSRMVAAARARGEPARWEISEGWSDRTGGASRRLAVEKAQRDGLLPAPDAKLLLEGPTCINDVPAEPAQRPEGLKRVLELLATLEDPWEKAERIREQRLQEQEQADRDQKAAIAAQVQDYRGSAQA